MKYRFLNVETPEEITAVAKLAREIWEQHFIPIIGKAQVEHMLARFQSESAIESQLKEGWEYYVVQGATEPAGYTAVVPDEPNKIMMLSKFYVKDSCRGSGVGLQALNFVENVCRDRGIEILWLTVNRHNDHSIEWYLKRGFRIVDEMKKDIGDGFYMDDFIMEKEIPMD